MQNAFPLFAGALFLGVAGCNPALEPELRKINSDVHFSSAIGLISGVAPGDALPPNIDATHPNLAAPGQESMHADAYNSDVHAVAGPSLAPFRVDSADMSLLFGGQCGNTLINADGVLFSFCPDIAGVSIFALTRDANGFRKIATPFVLPNRESSETLNLRTIMDDTSGGVYFHLDAQQRIVLVDAHNHLRIIDFDVLPQPLDGYTHRFVEVADHDLNAGLPPFTDADDNQRQPDVTDVLPDWNDAQLYWFLTRQGHVGIVDTAAGSLSAIDMQVVSLPGEEFLNSAAMDANGFYALSDHAAYKFVRGSDSTPVVAWRQPYNRGTVTKPGQVNQGTGTTPTLLGRNDDLLAFTDNADGAINLVVHRRIGDEATASNSPICTVPLFNDPVQSLGNGNYRSATDNSPIGYLDSLIVENTYGYTLPTSADWAAPGLWRIDVVRDAADQAVGCTVVWKNNDHSATAVPKLSTANGLVYFYAREPIGLGAPHEITRAYYFGALNFSDGAMVFQTLVGTGAGFNDNYSPITIAPDGTAYVGVFAGIVAVE